MARGRQSKRATRTRTETPDETLRVTDNDAGDELDVSAAQSEMDVDDENDEVEVDEGDGDDDGGEVEGSDEDEQEQEQEQDAPVPVKRGRGRPKGSGRPKPRHPTGRPRGRPRGKTVRPAKGSIMSVHIGSGDGMEDEQVVYKNAIKIGPESYNIENDEFATPNNKKGDAKVDTDGNLLGGRQFKASTFTIPSRHPTRKYMLAIDAARTSGFKDSLYYFRRNPLMLKLTLSQTEKDKLIEDGKLSAHLKSRSVTLVTARSAYKMHGAKMIKDGRWVVDDYDEEKVLAILPSIGAKAGDLVGELQDPNAGPAASKLTTYVAAQPSTGLAIYRPGAPSTLFGGPGLHPFSREVIGAGNTALGRISSFAREGVTQENWMFEAARRTWESNARFLKARKERMGVVRDGMPVVYKKKGDDEEKEKIGGGGGGPEKSGSGSASLWKTLTTPPNRPVMGWVEPHTDTIHYRKDTQPTRARWEVLTTPAPELADVYPKFHPHRSSPSTSDAKSVGGVSTEGLEYTRILSGTRVGQGAWGVAVVRTCMEVGKSGYEIEVKRKRKRVVGAVRREEAKRSRLAEPGAGQLGEGEEDSTGVIQEPAGGSHIVPPTILVEAPMEVG